MDIETKRKIELEKVKKYAERCFNKICDDTTSGTIIIHINKIFVEEPNYSVKPAK